MKQNVSELPRIRAMIRSDGTGDLTIDGVSQRIVAADEAGVREEIINRVADAAREIGRPVRLTAEDEQGQSPLIVHPDGDVESDGAFIPTPAGGSATARSFGVTQTTAPAAEATETLAIDVVASPEPYDATLADARPGVDVDTDSDGADLDATGRGAAPLDAAVLGAPHTGFVPARSADPLATAALRPFENLMFDPSTGLDSDLDDSDLEDSDLDLGSENEAHAVPRSASPFIGLVPASPAPVLGVAPGDGAGPNLADFMNSRPPLVAGPAVLGWQGTVRRVTGGLVSPAPGNGEMSHRAAVSAVQRSLIGPRTIVVLNPKGGAHKTTATLLIAATFGIHRGGYTLAWDNNETMGTLGVRAQTAAHTNTAVDLLRDLDNFAYSSSARVGDLDNYVRNQGEARFDALASDLDPAGAASIDDVAFGKLHAALSRFYRVLIIDTGNNMRASNWEAAVETADQLVVVSTIREDTAYGAASLLDGLRQKGHADKVAQAVTILASPAKTADRHLSSRLHDHFSQLTRAVVDVPYDTALVAGGSLNIDALAPRTREAWLLATAAIAEGL
ncbi:MAG: chromosome partitioning protein [Ramlibacter sp.]|nr:chromosome partitioning protein [Cryobacterium sp.]